MSQPQILNCQYDTRWMVGNTGMNKIALLFVAISANIHSVAVLKVNFTWL